MMRKIESFTLVLVSLLVASIAAAAVPVELTAVTFPERNTIRLKFAATDRAPRGEVDGKVTFKEAQARVEIDFKKMKPAVLFGGDITCYVVWAVSRDNTFENLGELWMPDNSGSVDLSTGRKAFALMITAEPHPRVHRPSELVMFTNEKSREKTATSTLFSFADLDPAPDHDMESIANIAWDSDVPLDLMQAEKAYELAQRAGAADYAERLLSESSVAVGQARNLARSGSKKTRLDYSRRAIELASEAIEVTERRIEGEKLAREIEARRAEMTALDERARAAELQAVETEKQRVAAEAAVAAADEQLGRLNAEQNALQAEHVALMSSMEILRTEGEELRAEAEKLRIEREELSNRLQGALSQVADTHSSARGFIVNLPDILFDVNKATLKHEAQLVIAKIGGILLIMPELNLRIEGHTDSQGSDEYNEKLSEQRADSVKDFLEISGIGNGRMTSVGYGESRPVADNDTTAGRQQNRRVEIIIAEGEIAEAAAPSN